MVFSSLAVWFASDVHSSSDYGAVEDAVATSTLFSSKHQLKIFDQNLHTVFCKREVEYLNFHWMFEFFCY